MVCNPPFDDGLIIGTFDGYLYVIRFYIHSGACCVDVKFTNMYFL
jgi:hypothetical protein